MPDSLIIQIRSENFICKFSASVTSNSINHLGFLNRMELMAVIVALEALKKEGVHITIYSDSQYVVKAVEQGWLKNWIATDFKGGKKNKDLWLRYHALSKKHHVKFVWVKGHASNAFNNRCDVLATTAADGRNLAVDEGYEADN